MSRRIASLACAVACLQGCGGGTGLDVFSPSWNDDGGRAIAALQHRLASVPIPLGADVVVGVTDHASKLVGEPLAGGARWTYAHALDARPVIAGGVVVGSGGGELFALDALTGKQLWARATGGLALHGAGDDGTITVVTLARASGRGSTLLAIAHDGSVLRQLEPTVALGSPAVVSRLAFVPWDNQYVSVLDVTDGSEVGRVLLREKTSHAWTVSGDLYFGEIGIFRFDDTIKNASRGRADHVALPARQLPGHPLLMEHGDEARKLVAGAADKVRLYARPTPIPEPLALDSARFYATYFRLLYGFTADHGSLAWVHTHPTAIIAGAAARGAFIACDDRGKVTTFDARNGAILGDPLDLGAPLESCVVQADGFHNAGAAHDPGPLVEQIRVALSDRDLELGAGQAVLFRELGVLPDEEATNLLLRIATDPRTTPSVRKDVRRSLASRRSGARYLIAALAKHYDFLHDRVLPPPAGALARALAAMHEKSAAPVLVAHLLDPATSDEDVRALAQALTTIAGPAEVPELLRFFALYRDAPPTPEEIPEAVNAVGETLLRIGGAPARAAIDTAIRQPATNGVVRAKLRALVDAAALQPATPSTMPSSTSRE
jgi:outer membrane protein assembly factor BamB